jgi:hypothetical protein
MRAFSSRAALAAVAAAIERAPGGGWLVARHGGFGAAAAAAAVSPPPGVASVRRLRVAHAGSLGSAGASLCVQRFVVGVSPPSCSRVSLASFSSDGRSGKVSFEEAKILNGRLVASASVRELLSVVHASYQDFNAVNVATSWNKLAKLAGGGERRGLMRRGGDREDVANAVQLLSEETTHMANAMEPQAVGNTLWAIGKLAERGVDVDAAVVRAVSDAAARVASKMKPQHVSNSMHAFANLSEKGVQVDAAAVQAVSAAAVGVASEMNAQDVSNAMWAFAKLAEKGLDVDVAAVRAVSDAAPRVAGGMIPQHVSNTLWAMSKFAEKGLDVNAAAVRAVSDAAPRVENNSHQESRFTQVAGAADDDGALATETITMGRTCPAANR